MTIQANKHLADRSFEVGDYVFLQLQPYRQQSVQQRRAVKLSPRFYSPSKIVQRIGAVAYTLQLPPVSRIHPSFMFPVWRKRWETGRLFRRHCLLPTNMVKHRLIWKSFRSSAGPKRSTRCCRGPNQVGRVRWRWCNLGKLLAFIQQLPNANLEDQVSEGRAMLSVLCKFGL